MAKGIRIDRQHCGSVAPKGLQQFRKARAEGKVRAEKVARIAEARKLAPAATSDAMALEIMKAQERQRGLKI